jgi:hypothetical protein
MPIYYVDSAATGSGTGASWTNAFTSLAAALTAITEAPGDEFLLSHQHSETAAAALTAPVNVSGTNRGIRIRSVNKANNVPTYGARIVLGANAFSSYGVVEGLHFDNSGVAASITINPGADTEFSLCRFSKQADQAFILSTNTGSTAVARACTFAPGAGFTRLFETGVTARWTIVRPIILGPKGTNVDLFNQAAVGHSANFTITDADLTLIDNIIDGAPGGGVGALNVTCVRCALPASYAIDDGLDRLQRKGSRVMLVGCRAAPILAPIVDRALYLHYGQAVIQTAVYRVNGASDGTTPHAWAITSYADRTWRQSSHAAQTPDLVVGWVMAGIPVTISAFVAHAGVGAGAGGRLRNDGFWMDIAGPSDAASPTAQAYTASSMAAFGGTPTDLADDTTSSWVGAGTTVKQRIDLTYTPTVSGPLTARLSFARESATDALVYADAAIHLS